MRTLKIAFALFLATIFVGSLAASGARAAVPSPAWSIQSLATPTNFAPGEPSEGEKQPRYEVFLTNSGGEKTDSSPITVTDTLPAGLAVKRVVLHPLKGEFVDPAFCETKVDAGTEVSTLSCEVTNSDSPEREPARLAPDQNILLVIEVTVPPTATDPLLNRVEVKGGGAETVTLEAENNASAEGAKAGFEEFHAELTDPDGKFVGSADSHPYQYTTSFAVNLVPTPAGSQTKFVPAEGSLKQIEVALPPGLVGNPTAVPRCTAQQFSTTHSVYSPVRKNYIVSNECPVSSVVGVANVELLEGESFDALHPIYNLIPPKGMPAELGFEVQHAPIYINTRVRSGSDYGITAFLSDVTEAKRISASRVIIWGVPWEASHDATRGECTESWEVCSVEGEGPVRPFLRAPSQCADPLLATMSFTTWALPVTGASEISVLEALTGCAFPPFEPSIEAQPTSSVADSSTGLNVDLHVPQPEGCKEEAKLLTCETGEADLRDAKIVLPAGMTVNPSSADGLESCSEAQVGYLPQRSAEAGRPQFTPEPAECPDASKLGGVEVVTPLLGHPLPGAIYLAAQDANPFNSMLAVYITVYDPVSGVVVKLPGRVTLDPASGRLTTSFEENPQLPFNDFKVDLFSGSRAALATPLECGSYSTSTDMTPWSAPEGKDTTPSSKPFTVATTPGGAPCVASEAQAPNAPGFEAGAASPVAATYSPFVLKLTREDASQRFSGLNVTLPPGLIGKIAGLQQCPQAAIDSALARSHEGEGAVELAQPSCPAGSEIGTVRVGAGSGAPFYVTGHAYFAGPYKGAPFSLVIVTPAVAGPFDLGTVVVRAGLYIDPSTAQVTVSSDPFPTILDGIPLDIRSVNVDISRKEFVLNPTSCNVMSVTAQELSTAGQTAALSDRFQAGGCTSLPFRPMLTASTSGKASKADGASLTVKIASKPGQEANAHAVDLTIPKGLPARLTTLQKACTEAQFNANPAGCPAASDIGTVVVHTPLLNVPLTGPAYLVSHGGAAFPDVEQVLQGEGVTVIVDGKTQIKNGVTYSHFDTVPDAPFTSFEFTAPQGPHSIFSANVPQSAHYSLCGQHLTMPVTLTGQNGAGVTQTTKIAVTGCPKVVKKALTRAQKLKAALKVCRKVDRGKTRAKRRKRKVCEMAAQKRYGPDKKAKKHEKKK